MYSLYNKEGRLLDIKKSTLEAKMQEDIQVSPQNRMRFLSCENIFWYKTVIELPLGTGKDVKVWKELPFKKLGVVSFLFEWNWKGG